jgi:hypothetical protein
VHNWLGKYKTEGLAGLADYARPEALSALAEHLPPDLLAQALATAAAITDDSARAEALSALAEHLPPDLLGQALAATTKESIQAITALLDRANLTSHQSGMEHCWVCCGPVLEGLTAFPVSVSSR